MEDLKRVYITQDSDCHWYILPYELKDEFLAMDEKLSSMFGDESGDLEEEFERKFSKYRIGGDINLIELYARI